MAKTLIQIVEHYDDRALMNAYEHPTMRNIENAIVTVTDVGVDALTFEATGK